MIFACIAVIFAMMCQDTFGTTMCIAEAKNIGRLAGGADALNDYASRIGGALTAGSYVRTGLWSWQTQLLLALTALTSYNTTRRVVPAVHRLLDSPSERIKALLVKLK